MSDKIISRKKKSLKNKDSIKYSQVYLNLKLGSGNSLRISKPACLITQAIVTKCLENLGKEVFEYLIISQKKTISQKVLVSVLEKGRFKYVPELKEIAEKASPNDSTIQFRVSMSTSLRALSKGIKLGGEGYNVSMQAKNIIPMIARAIIQKIGLQASKFVSVAGRHTILEKDVNAVDPL